jgi:hypothetical protein
MECSQQTYPATPASEYLGVGLSLAVAGGSKNSKHHMREEVFASKYKVIDGLEGSNSSGIDVQQKNEGMECCHNC